MLARMSLHIVQQKQQRFIWRVVSQLKGVHMGFVSIRFYQMLFCKGPEILELPLEKRESGCLWH